MWKPLVFFVVLVALLEASELRNEDGNIPQDELNLNANAPETKDLQDEQDSKQADALTGDQSSDPFMSDGAQFVEDDSKDLEELSNEQDSDAMDMKIPDQKKTNADSKKSQESQLVERGWRKRRGLAAPPPPPSSRD